MTPLEEVVYDVPNSNNKDCYIVIKHHVFNPINIEVDVEVEVAVYVAITTNMELQLILSESMDKSVHFLVIFEETPTKKVEEFISFSFDNGGKA
ncbi:hypothetical protein J1N35_019476 [Gossypium stocksii]|uniref:Uncharacterized protein n=1 Tax=Gossypium stocksii TaxID=47602 RepID=A0A9D3VR02_9ROSI|nr:hypothetical protein J1N35_019476 [Gossypium stocksii]